MEEDGGAYTSLNAEYPRLLEAIVTVSKWRSQPGQEEVDEAKLKVVSTTSNRYLRYLGARFLKEATRNAIPTVEKILAHPTAGVAFPEAECAHRDNSRRTRRAFGPRVNATTLDGQARDMR